MSEEAARRWGQQSSRKRRGGTSDADAAFKKIRYSAESHIPAAETRRMIAAHFQQNDELSVVDSTYRVFLLCPLSKARMSVAARGTDCTHIQCFDLEQYLELQVQSSLWACPICSKQLRQAHLRVDLYFTDALRTLRNRPEVTDLDLLPTGDYTAVEPQRGTSCEDVPDDGSPYVPAPVEPKREPMDAGDDSEAPAATAANASSPQNRPAESGAVDLVVIDDEEPLPSSTTSRRRQRKSGKRHGPVQKEAGKLLDSLAKKEAELSRREELLQSANEENQRLRYALADKERQESQFRQKLSEADADRARLRHALEEAQRRPVVKVPANYVPCEAEIDEIDKIKSIVQGLETTVDRISSSSTRGKSWRQLTNPFEKEHPLHNDFQSMLIQQRSKASAYRHHKKCEEIVRRRMPNGTFGNEHQQTIAHHQQEAARLLADSRSLRLELLSTYQTQRLPATKLQELALLHEQLRRLKQEERHLHENLQKAKSLAPH